MSNLCLIVIECPSRPDFTSDEIKGCARDADGNSWRDYGEENRCTTQECPNEDGCEIRSIGGDCKLTSSTVCFCDDKLFCNAANNTKRNFIIGMLVSFFILVLN